jgi:hypothetical protein
MLGFTLRVSVSATWLFPSVKNTGSVQDSEVPVGGLEGQQMIYRINLYTWITFIGGAIGAGITHLIVGGDEKDVMLLGFCIGGALCDVVIRVINGREDPEALLSPRAGGHVWYIPVWFLGVLGIILTGVTIAHK